MEDNIFCFFFHAEDGIRDLYVTGVQTCALPISVPVEDVAKSRGEPPWYQLYMPLTWDATEKMVRRVEAAGCPAMAWTVDLDRKSTRLNSSHVEISYAVFCLKKKNATSKCTCALK